MKYFIYIMIVLCLPTSSFSQDITGLWKGTMYNDSTKQSLPYEIVINNENGKYTGFSHSWFLIEGKQYYGIKKIKVRVAKDGKIIIQDAALINNNYPVSPDKNVSQLNVLNLSSIGIETILEGPFVTNRTKNYNELTGRINIKKVNSLSESVLMEYLQKSGSDNGLTAVK
jgi:hypothetical protein